MSLLSPFLNPRVSVPPVPHRHCQVYLNGSRLPIKSFADYCDLYLGPKENGVPRIHERVNDRWEIVISATDGQFQQVRCFVGVEV